MRKTILITGAGTGIGRDAAFALAGRGHRVIATTYSEAQADALRAECQVSGRTLEVRKLDITCAADRAQVLDFIQDQALNDISPTQAGFIAGWEVRRQRVGLDGNPVIKTRDQILEQTGKSLLFHVRCMSILSP